MHISTLWHPRASQCSLRELIADLILDTVPLAHRHCSNVINEVDAGLFLPANLYKARAVMSELLHTVVRNSHCGDIHISAMRAKDRITLQVQERNNYNGYALAFSVHAMDSDAACAGGQLLIKDERQRITTIYFSFSRELAA